MSGMKKFMAKMSFGLKARMSLYERMQAFLEANIDVVSTLRSIRDRYMARKKSDNRAYIINEWLTVIEKGGKFGDAVREWVPSSEHMLISAGERGEGLISGLREAGVMSSAASRSKSAVIGGLLFPIALVAMEMGMLIMFQTQMVPVFKGLLAIEKWPAAAQTLNSLSKFLNDYLWLVVLGIIGMSTVIMVTMGRWTRYPRRIFDKFPPWSVYRSYQGSSFLIGLSSLMNAGVPHYDAIRMMHRTASPWMRVHLEKMMSNLRLGGANPGKALDTGLLDVETVGDVEDYGRLSSFPEAIKILGSRSIEKGVKSIEAKMAIVKNLMLVMVACSIVWIYFTSYGLQTTIAESMNKPR
jgi:type II secretory pathway component PulF